MTTKEELVEHIKEWIQIDNEIKMLQKEIKERRNRKKELSGSLLDIMKDNEIECFDINDGKLLYSQTKVRSSLSKKHLISCLLQYFDNDKEQAIGLSQHILNSREVKVKETIKRKVDKSNMALEKLTNQLLHNSVNNERE
jgi:hypothetical protein